ncbi:hypothetical protein A9P44_00395 [Paenibacillus polymyxa]|nr:DUF4200 domain-containing protein [Paenibacillus polymyxa]OBA07846.1 hypothetical protein A9P44_00395 [Paenibacillus polymyxa]
MTDKPRLIDADKLIKWFAHAPDSDGFLEGSSCVNSFNSLTDAISSGLFDPDPPQQPEERYWQKRMERERERADSAEADFQALSDNYDELKKAKYYWERKRTEHKNRADRAESLIQQKDAEIARLKHIISMARTEHELWENPASAAECMMIWLDKAYETHVQPEHASGDTP